MRTRELVLGIVLLVATSCATMQSCNTLYFGTARANGAPVSAEEWSRFAAEVLTREFPNGLTTWEADGEWRGADGQHVAERSHVVAIVDGDDAAIARVIAEYKRRFAQEAVLRVTTRCRATF